MYRVYKDRRLYKLRSISDDDGDEKYKNLKRTYFFQTNECSHIFYKNIKTIVLKFLYIVLDKNLGNF